MANVNQNLDSEKVYIGKGSSFPIQAFHSTIQQILSEYNKTLGYNYDYLGAAFLYATSLAIGNSTKIRVKKGWDESALIWICTIGKSGFGKSHPQSSLLLPFREIDSANFKKYEEELETYRKSIQTKENKSFKKKNGVQSENETQLFLDPPKRHQFLLQDFTVEALCYSHYENPAGIGIFSDEILQWLENIGRYTKSGEEQFYLSIWSGREINVNRKSQPHIHIENPFINVLGSLQVDLLGYALGKNRQKSGFSSRILFAFPDSIIREPFTDDEIADIYLDTYRNFILSIVNRRPNSTKVIPFSQEAFQYFKNWKNNYNNKFNKEDDGDITGIYAKLEIYLVRLSLILQVMNDTLGSRDTSQVEISAIKGASELIDYFEKTALKVNSIIKRYSDPLNDYPMDKRIIYAALPAEFATKDGEKIANQFKMPKRTFFAFLKDDVLFRKVKYAHYEKKY